MHPALYDKSAAILTQHSIIREAFSVQRIADLPPYGGRREREPAGAYPPALIAGYYSPYDGTAGLHTTFR